MAVRVCSKCKVEKDISEYWKRKKGKDGISPVCILCAKEKRDNWKAENLESVRKYYKEYAQRNVEKINEYNRNWRDKNREKCRLAGRKWDRANYEKKKERTKQRRIESVEARNKHRARGRFGYEIEMGRIVRPEVCSECEITGNIHGHHEDYSKPFDVIWLCKECHIKAHYAKESNCDKQE